MLNTYFIFLLEGGGDTVVDLSSLNFVIVSPDIEKVNDKEGTPCKIVNQRPKNIFTVRQIYWKSLLKNIQLLV